jgi:putative tryptophan/tyrosine transport system substrate-binding protein
MRRREFIPLCTSAALLPFAARAQPTPAIGFLYEGLPEPLPLMQAFRQGLNEAGIREASNVSLENRWAEGQYARLPALVTELLENRVRVIAAAYLVAAVAAKAATQSVPIVFVTGSDPVAAGLVSSLNRPTSNLTGVAFMFTRLGSKNLAILHELVPKAVVIGVLVNPNNPNAEPQLRDLEIAARMLALQLVVLRAGTSREIDIAFGMLAERRIQALVVTADGYLFSLQKQFVTLAARYKMPTIYPLSDYAQSGGLISYGANRSEAFRQTGFYVGRVLEGVHPADLPVLQAARFELVVNLTAAKALGITVPPALLTLADEVIE